MRYIFGLYISSIILISGVRTPEANSNWESHHSGIGTHFCTATSIASVLLWPLCQYAVIAGWEIAGQHKWLNLLFRSMSAIHRALYCDVLSASIPFLWYFPLTSGSSRHVTIMWLNLASFHVRFLRCCMILHQWLDNKDMLISADENNLTHSYILKTCMSI